MLLNIRRHGSGDNRLLDLGKNKLLGLRRSLLLDWLDRCSLSLLVLLHEDFLILAGAHVVEAVLPVLVLVDDLIAAINCLPNSDHFSVKFLASGSAVDMNISVEVKRSHMLRSLPVVSGMARLNLLGLAVEEVVAGIESLLGVLLNGALSVNSAKVLLHDHLAEGREFCGASFAACSTASGAGCRAALRESTLGHHLVSEEVRLHVLGRGVGSVAVIHVNGIDVDSVELHVLNCFCGFFN